MIASNRTAALVAMDGTIDWACMPNFNSEPIFCSILDKNKGGYFTITPENQEDVTSGQFYLDHTNVLMTEFYNNGRTVLRLTDFIPTSEFSTINFPEIHRYIETPATDMKIRVELKPSFNYGRDPVLIEKNHYGFMFRGSKDNIALSTDMSLREKGNLVSGTIQMEKGSSKWAVVAHGVNHIERVTDYRSYERLEETSSYWKAWVSQAQYSGIYSKAVSRSSLALKALFYEPSGMMVAAPTSSLPESIGGERNWDYRYSWIRDTAYVVEALLIIGYKREAIKFIYDMMEIIKREGRIRTIYSINSHSDLDEIESDFEGYMGSRPVRFGNKASEQLQIDEYGSIVNAIYFLSSIGGIVNSYLWDFVGEILGELQKIWNTKDSSIWEFRSAPEHYTYSKVMAWAAFTRAIEIGKKLNYTGHYQRWQSIANEIKQSVLENGFDKSENSFVQYYGAKHTDSALLRMPLLGFLPANDPRMKGTIQKIEKDLMMDGYLFKRYPNDDGLKSRDNAFTLLSFWYLEVLVEQKEYTKAREVFESLLERGNHLGLFSEEIDFDTGDQVGNFPQAMTHLGIIRAAKKLNEVFKKNLSGKHSNLSGKHSNMMH